MVKYKVEVFTVKESFSCLQEGEDTSNIIENLDIHLNNGAVKMILTKPRAKSEEIVIIPRERIEYVKVKALEVPKNNKSLEEKE
jgi:hypothetical protein